MAHDVTDLNAYEHQIFLLMREVNHRAKNMRGLVQAISGELKACLFTDVDRQIGQARIS